MAATLTEANVLGSVIKQEELAGLISGVTGTQAEIVTIAINEAMGEIKLAINPDVYPDDAIVKIWKALAVASLYPPWVELPKRRKDDLDWARGMLKSMQTGEVGRLGGVWGSEKKVRFNFRDDPVTG